MADPTIALGSSGQYVVALQEGLNQFQGFSFPITGQFDQTTRAAVMQFQKLVGLQADGVVGQQTWDALRAALKQLQAQQPPPDGGEPTPGAIPFDPLMVTGEVPGGSGMSGMMWLSVLALGGLVYYQSKKKKERSGPGQPIGAATEHDEDEPSEDADTWEERARAKRKRMRRSELIFGPDASSKKPSGGTVMKNTNRKPTFKVRSEESARQVPRSSKGRSGSHSRGGESATDTRKVDEELWLTQARGSGRSTTPIRHGVQASTFKTNPEHYRKWAREKAAAENRVVFIVDQKTGRELFRVGTERKLSGARRQRMADAVTDSLIDEPAIVAESGKVSDCEKAAKLLTKRKLLARAEHERAHFKRVVRAVADSCRTEEAQDAIARVIEHEEEVSAEAAEDMPDVQSRKIAQGVTDDVRAMRKLLEQAQSGSEHGGARRVVAKHIRRSKGKSERLWYEKDTSKKSGRRLKREEVQREPKRSWRAGPGRPTIQEERGKRGERSWRREKWFGPRIGPRRPPKGD